MATLLPPPKRVKVYHGVPEPAPEVPKPSPNIVVQFVSEDDGKPLAPAVNLPSNVSREGLEALVNKLSTQVSLICTIKFQMHSIIHGMARMTTQCPSHFIYHYQRMLHLQELPPESLLRNRFRPMYFRIHLRHSPRKMYSSSIVRRNLCSE